MSGSEQYVAVFLYVALTLTALGGIVIIALALVPTYFRMCRMGTDAHFSLLPMTGLLLSSISWYEFADKCVSPPLKASVLFDCGIAVAMGALFAVIHLWFLRSSGKGAILCAASAIAASIVVPVTAWEIVAAQSQAGAPQRFDIRDVLLSPTCGAGTYFALTCTIPLLLCGFVDPWMRPLSCVGRCGRSALLSVEAGTAADDAARARTPEGLFFVLFLFCVAWSIIGLAAGVGPIATIGMLGAGITFAHAMLVCRRGCCCGSRTWQAIPAPAAGPADHAVSSIEQHEPVEDLGEQPAA